MKIINKVIASLVVTTTIFSCTPILATNDKPVNNNNIGIDQKIGINGYIDCKFDNLQACSIFRENHSISLTFDSISKKSYFKSSSYDFDEFYKNLYMSGITIVPSIQQNYDVNNKENKPVDKDADTVNPESYKIHSNVLFNYAARYGSSKLDKDKLNITQGTSPLSGLGYIQYYENWDKPDKSKYGDKAHFSAEEFAAMCSADYDGHEGTLGNTYGIKQADSNSKLVLGGISTESDAVEYLNNIKKWCENNRKSKTLPFDIINFQYYSDSKSPESSDFIKKTEDIIKWKNENAPDKEIWISEFGWDTNISSPNGATSSDTQRDWIVREYLLSDRIGLNRAIVNCSRDNGNANSSSSLATCGLTSQKGKEERKSSWYGVNTLKNTLSGFVFSGVIKEASDMYIYKYTNKSTGEDCYVLWCPTENNNKVDNYALDIGENTGANLIQLQHNAEVGASSTLTVENNSVKVNVSESPVFVKVSPSKKMITLNKSKVEKPVDINYQNINASNKDYESTITDSPTVQEQQNVNLKKLGFIGSLLSLASVFGLFFI